MNVKLKTLRHFNRGGVSYVRGTVYQVDDATAESLHATGHFDRWPDQEPAKAAPAPAPEKKAEEKKADEPKKDAPKADDKKPAPPAPPAKPEETPVKV